MGNKSLSTVFFVASELFLKIEFRVNSAERIMSKYTVFDRQNGERAVYKYFMNKVS